MRLMRSFRGFLTILAAFAGAAAAHAGGFGIPEMGARRTAMAAVVGRPDEPAAVFHNPAGLTLLAGTRLYLSLGVSRVDSSFRLRPWEESDRFISDPVDAEGYYPATAPSRAMGVIPMLVATHEILPGKLWGAASLYVSNATGSRFDEDAPTRYHLIDGYIVSPQASLSAAWRARPWLSAGAGIGLMNIRIEGRRYVYPIVMGSDLSGFLGPKSELDLSGSDWVPTWNAGLLATPHPRVTIGASVIGESKATIEGPIQVGLADGGHLDGTQRTALLLPWTFLGGVNVDVARHVEVGAELRYFLYRRYHEQRIEVDRIYLVEEIVTPKNYRDSWQVSGGVRVHDLELAPRLEAMLGVHYDRTPAPPNTVSLDQPTFTHRGLHGGVRHAFGRYRLGLTWAHYWYEVPTIEGSLTTPPSNIRATTATNDIVTASVETEL
jgi:long-chain fatty acid transport protein